MLKADFTQPATLERVYLADAEGRFLHLSGTMMTTDKHFRWIGSTTQARNIRLKYEVARHLVAHRIPNPKTIEVFK